jgi:thiamine transport system ATP-binding protein
MTLTVRGLAVDYGGADSTARALVGVDLDVDTGEVLCVLGPSGCGKSTLLRAITGLVPPSEGRVSWDGDDLTRVPVHRRNFGLMFQDHALFPHMDVAGNVAFGLRMQRLDRRRRAARVEEMLELVGLSGFGARRVDELSGGEQQRVALARSLAPDPCLLLLDEPLGALDRGLRDRLVGDLRALFQHLGTTVLYVTHDQDEALTVADRVAVMRSGAIEQIGSPVALWRHPNNEFVARFLGATNIVRCPVTNGVARLVVGEVPVAATLASGEVTVILRRDALRVDPGGALRGEVVGRRFNGDVIATRVAVGGIELDIGLDEEVLPELGESLRLSFDSSRALVLPSEADDSPAVSASGER